MIRLNRGSEYRDKTRNYKIVVDGKHIKDIKDGERLEFELSEGNHTIYLKIDWCRSNTIDFHLAANEVITFNCGNSMKGWKIFFSFLYVTIFKNRYLWLERV